MFSELTYGTALPAPHCERVPGITHWCKAVNNQSLPVENSQVSHISKAFYLHVSRTYWCEAVPGTWYVFPALEKRSLHFEGL